MRALLYVAQQIGRPVSEADVRMLSTVPDSGLDEHSFLLAGKRLGFHAIAIDSKDVALSIGVNQDTT